MARTPEHYAKFSDKEIYNALCQVSPDLRRAFSIQHQMILSGWSEEEVFEMLKHGADAEFAQDLDGIQGHLVRRALRHLVTTFNSQRSSAPLN